MGVRFITRAEWGAGPLRSGHVVPHPQFTGLATHHTVSVLRDYDRDGFLHGDLDDIYRYMRNLQVSRPDLGNEVPYSFVVFRGARPEDGLVAEGRGFGVTGAHTAGQNSTRYGVAYAGNSSVEPATDGVLEGFRWVGQHLHAPHSARPTIGHRDVKATACPGHSIYENLPRIQPPFFTAHVSGDDDLTAEQRLVLADGWVRDSYRIAGRTEAAIKTDTKGVQHWTNAICNGQISFGYAREQIIAGG